MNVWVILFRVIVLLIGVIVLSFDVLLYNICEQQKSAIISVKDRQEVESEFNVNKFKTLQDQIDHAGKDLEDARQQIKEQKDALLQEVEKRQEVETENKSVQTSLIDIKAEADAIKQDMKDWQKDYVAVLAQLEKKMDNSQDEIKAFENNLTALNIPELKENINSLKTDIEKITHPPDNSLSNVPPAPDKEN